MVSSKNDGDTTRNNRLLSMLPREQQERLLSRMEKVFLDIKDILWEPNQPIEYVYFPLNGVMSILSIMEDGLSAEIGTVGNEGMAGLPVFLGTEKTPLRAFSQIPGESLRLSVPLFRDEISKSELLTTLLHRYTQAMFVQIGQLAACNRLHSIEERCARWLLMTQDRVGADQFPLTQEFLGQMLGVRRASVNTVAGMFQKAGFIRYSRGKITVLDRAGLEGATCECYRVIRDEYDRLLG